MLGQQPASRASDMFAFGVMLGEVLLGRRFASGKEAQMHCDHDDIVDVLTSLLSREPAERFSAAALLLMPLFREETPLLLCGICMEEMPLEQVLLVLSCSPAASSGVLLSGEGSLSLA